MTPELRARQEIDRQLQETGWVLQGMDGLNISAGLGVAIREFPLTSGVADYMLYVDGKAIGVIEAKADGHTLTGVETQSAKYVAGLPPGLPHHKLPLPFSYESTGKQTQFTNALEPRARSRRVFTFHRPEELRRLVQLEKQVRQRLREMPPLDIGQLWRVQVESIQNLEDSLAANRPRALIQMATGSGKTFTAVNLCYRLIKYAGAKRILFLVDRNNLGRQTLNEFQQFRSPVNNFTFTEEYAVQHLTSNSIAPASKVCITTIQRLWSMLKGEAEYLEENEEGSLFETETESSDSKPSALAKKPIPAVYNPQLPIETFDFIIIDECHRSIYNLWRQVLEYFDAFLIGLTATPTMQTIGFFGQNLVQDYSHEKAVTDGVNVGFDVYTIETQITKDGAKLVKEPGIFVPRRDRRTKSRKYEELDDDFTYTANQLDRDVVSESQIRLVLKTFKEKLPEIFPGRTEVPKTLIFAKTDLHAEDIVRIAREEFNQGNDFCQKITSKSTGKKPETLLAEFRNSYNPRIAVTVDMIATGTDVKPLECLVFMRNIRSLSYFEQMKGRGCRIIQTDKLQSVTPDARAKTHFVIVDAVGVCQSEKTATKPLDRQPSVPLEKILKLVATGAVAEDLVSALGSRLARLAQQVDDVQEELIAQEAAEQSLLDLSATLLDSVDPDKNATLATARFELLDGEPPTEAQLNQIEQEQMTAALKPFHNPKLRDAILTAKRSTEQIIDEQTPDQLLKAGFDAQAREKAQALLRDFRQFIEEHKDEITALQVLYHHPYQAGLRFKDVKELAARLNQPPFYVDPHRPDSPLRLWQAFEFAEPEQVRAGGSGQLVDLIALVRHAIHPETPLAPLGLTIAERFQAWVAEQEAQGKSFTPEQRKWLNAIRDHIASSLAIEREDLEEIPFSQIGGLGRAFELFGERLDPLLEELNQVLAV